MPFHPVVFMPHIQSIRKMITASIKAATATTIALLCNSLKVGHEVLCTNSS